MTDKLCDCSATGLTLCTYATRDHANRTDANCVMNMLRRKEHDPQDGDTYRIQKTNGTDWERKRQQEQIREQENVVDKITSERGSVYGLFMHNALVAQAIKAVIADGLRLSQRVANDLPADVREALDLIALKISRIVTGDPEYLDNWHDIGGYAKIVADRIRGDRVKAEDRRGRIYPWPDGWKISPIGGFIREIDGFHFAGTIDDLVNWINRKPNEDNYA